jgi:hypothetical protein
MRGYSLEDMRLATERALKKRQGLTWPFNITREPPSESRPRITVTYVRRLDGLYRVAKRFGASISFRTGLTTKKRLVRLAFKVSLLYPYSPRF